MPSILTDTSYFDIDEVLKFTESQIETEFTENYNYCKIGMRAIFKEMFLSGSNESQILKMTVFDFVHGEAKAIILKAVKKNNMFVGEDSENEYVKIMDEINKLIYFE